MARPVDTRLRERREACGLSQVALAAAARLTRQSIGAIETGRATPAVDVALRLAAALECSVEELFGACREEPRVVAEPAGPAAEGRVALAKVGGRWVAHALRGRAAATAGDGIARRGAGGRVAVEAARSLAEVADNVVVMGCAPALGMLADRLNARSGPGRFVWLPASSTAALDALASRHAHVAGVHLVDARSGEPNLSAVRRRAGGTPMMVVTLARWEEGLVLPRGNPKGIRGVADFARCGLRLVAREPGSGARRVLDRHLRAAGVSCEPAFVASGHLEVGQAVAMGAADTGVATRDAAIAFDLDFVALAEERYDLVAPPEVFDTPPLRRWLDVMASRSARRDLEAAGYDVRACGTRVTDAGAE